MKPVVFFVRAIGEEHEKMASMVINSLRKFHPDVPIKLYKLEDIKRLEPELNFAGQVKGLDSFIPLCAKELIKEYELVVSLDTDQIILGDLNYLIDQRKNYDVGTVYNLNRTDPLRFELVQLQGIPPQTYFNIGLVAMTSAEFIDHWDKLCHSSYKDVFLYKDQDLFNLITHFGNYKVKCFDEYDYDNNYYAWHGVICKGEGVHMYLKDGKVILPKNKDNYPKQDTIVKAYHWAGGDLENKMNFNVHFTDDMVDYINWLISPSDQPYGKTN